MYDSALWSNNADFPRSGFPPGRPYSTNAAIPQALASTRVRGDSGTVICHPGSVRWGKARKTCRNRVQGQSVGLRRVLRNKAREQRTGRNQPEGTPAAGLGPREKRPSGRWCCWSWSSRTSNGWLGGTGEGAFGEEMEVAGPDDQQLGVPGWKTGISLKPLADFKQVSMIIWVIWPIKGATDSEVRLQDPTIDSKSLQSC